jgi:hypothetical protein
MSARYAGPSAFAQSADPGIEAIAFVGGKPDNKLP